MKRTFALAMILGVCRGVLAGTAEITDVTAQQRYPWNGLVDIAVTFSGASNDVANCDCVFVATNVAAQTALNVSHISDVDGAIGSGTIWTRKFIWDAAADVGEAKIDDVTLAVGAKGRSLGGVQLWEDGPFWAECNVGAAKPEDSGYYFWWGDTVGYSANTNSATWSDIQGGWSDVKWVSSAGVEMSESPFSSAACPTYNQSIAALRQSGYLDDSDNLASSCDAASAHLGAPWRMPTSAEIDALKEKCQKTFLVTNGVWGCLLIGQGAYSSRSIFLPAAGYGGGSDLYASGSKGYYWSASPNPAYAPDTWNLYLDSLFFSRHSHGRSGGLPVRALRGFGQASQDMSVSSSAATHLALDCRTGTRVAGVTERIAFSPVWETAATDAVATVTLNGVVVTNAMEAGAFAWKPLQDGTYAFAHVVSVGGTPVGEALSATFAVQGSPCPATPVISPENGTILTETRTVNISCASEGATIRCTTDGSEPTTESPVYNRFKVSGRTTVKARAFYENGNGSGTAVAEYALGQCPEPVVVSTGGTPFARPGNVVSIDWACADGVLRYTTDGSDVTAESPVYEAPFAIDVTTMVKAKAFGVEYFDSAQVAVELVRKMEKVATPVITAAAQFSGSRTKVAISCATPGAEIRYTTTGEEPNSQSPRYAGPFWVSASCTVKAIAVCQDCENSDFARFEISKTWGIGDTMGAPDHVFTTGGDAGFFREDDPTAPMGEAMRSGVIGDSPSYGTYTRSTLSTVVLGPGTLSFRWRSSCEEDGEYEWDHAELAVDDVVVARINGISDWQQVSQVITDAGAHRISWTYLKDDFGKKGDDCLRVADYSWVPAEPWTHESEVAVPYAWLREQFPEAIDEYDAYETLAKETAANGLKVWECFVAGLCATDPEASLRAFIEFRDGRVCISWKPNLNTGEVTRIYRLVGRTDLDCGDWETPAQPGHRFFKVAVSMPTGADGEESAVAGEGFVP